MADTVWNSTTGRERGREREREKQTEGEAQTIAVTRQDQTSSGWWFGCHQFYFPIHIGFLIIPIDALHHFSEGWLKTTNQFLMLQTNLNISEHLVGGFTDRWLNLPDVSPVFPMISSLHTRYIHTYVYIYIYTYIIHMYK